MAENATENTVESGEQTTEENTTETTAQADSSKKNEELGDAGKRALEAERKARKEAEKRAREFEARVNEFEDANRTEAEKQQRKLEKAQRELEEARAHYAELERKNLVAEVAAELEIPQSAWGRISGNTADEIRADAEELKALLAPTGPRKPAPVPEEGKVTEGKLSPGQVFESFFKSNF